MEWHTYHTAILMLVLIVFLIAFIRVCLSYVPRSDRVVRYNQFTNFRGLRK